MHGRQLVADRLIVFSFSYHNINKFAGIRFYNIVLQVRNAPKTDDTYFRTQWRNTAGITIKSKPSQEVHYSLVDLVNFYFLFSLFKTWKLPVSHYPLNRNFALFYPFPPTSWNIMFSNTLIYLDSWYAHTSARSFVNSHRYVCANSLTSSATKTPYYKKYFGMAGLVYWAGFKHFFDTHR